MQVVVMEELDSEHKPVWTNGWIAAALAVVATVLLGVDVADQNLASPAEGVESANSYAAVFAAGATVSPTDHGIPVGGRALLAQNRSEKKVVAVRSEALRVAAD
ncbi:hypothetical protein [Bradyrhizobium iriomotense]|uniref:Uncharacterized protein n=1 Tax=Bradyrhizobium iriomotense TaxID=441950 RepID=A0ABQ6B0K5_9BRAD|nr:hypothetical protein [Bradyrhizobium iriomotense]GLR87348.1 hypothetical protein GCM10007857_40590 [Bradyrhizobium iriomotense]